MNIIYIGYWNNSSNQYPEFPLPVNGIPFDNSEDIEKLSFVLNKSSVHYCKGFSPCRLCNKTNGSEEYHLTIKNTKYIIPEGYLHYVKDHFVPLSQNFHDLYNRLTKNKKHTLP